MSTKASQPICLGLDATRGPQIALVGMRKINFQAVGRLLFCQIARHGRSSIPSVAGSLSKQSISPVVKLRKAKGKRK